MDVPGTVYKCLRVTTGRASGTEKPAELETFSSRTAGREAYADASSICTRTPNLLPSV